MANSKNSPSQFYQQRNRAIYDTYLRIARSHPEPLNIDQLVEEVSRSPQPKFWVPARTIYNILRCHRRLSQDTPDAAPARSASPLTRAVIATYHRIRNRHHLRGKALSFIADFVAAEPATGFFLSKRRLRDIIRRMRKQNFRARCAAALSGLQAFERHTIFYGQATHK